MIFSRISFSVYFPEKHIVTTSFYRKLSAAGWSHRAVAIGDIVGIYHFSMVMGSYGDSSADMADDQV